MNKIREMRDFIESAKQELRTYIGYYDTTKVKERLDSLLLWGQYYDVHYDMINEMSIEELLEFADNIDSAIDSIINETY